MRMAALVLSSSPSGKLPQVSMHTEKVAQYIPQYLIRDYFCFLGPSANEASSAVCNSFVMTFMYSTASVPARVLWFFDIVAVFSFDWVSFGAVLPPSLLRRHNSALLIVGSAFSSIPRSLSPTPSIQRLRRELCDALAIGLCPEISSCYTGTSTASWKMSVAGS